ncbi:hypothetical protein RKD42_005965 [Streptomyces ambofaciens]
MRVAMAVGDVQVDVGVEALTGGSGPGEQAAAFGAEAALAPLQGAQQQLVLGTEVVEEVAAAHADLAAERRHGELLQAALGDHLHGGGEHVLARRGLSAPTTGHVHS